LSSTKRKQSCISETKAGLEIHQEVSMPLVNLQKNAALHCLATSFLLEQHLTFEWKYIINDAKEKIKNLSMPAKKGPWKSSETIPLS
jgi:hypothetical protein